MKPKADTPLDAVYRVVFLVLAFYVTAEITEGHVWHWIPLTVVFVAWTLQRGGLPELGDD